jgi:hypothetical protein
MHGGAARFGFDPAAHLTETSSLVTGENRERLFAEWVRYWDTSRPFLLEKSPPNLIRTRFLQAMFPESYFVIIVRHPIAYAFPRGKASPPRMVHSLIRHWVTCHDIFREDRPRLRNSIVIEYERFVDDPSGYLARIYSFLGLENSPLHQEIRKNINRKYLEGWNDARKGLVTGVWMKYVIWKYEERIRKHGYSLVNPEDIRGFSR